MLIKHNNLDFNLDTQEAKLIFLIGQQPYQLNQIAHNLKTQWKKDADEDASINIIEITKDADWHAVEQEAYSNSLFSSDSFIDIRYDKKTLDSAGKIFLNRYLSAHNPHCTLLFRAPLLSIASLKTISSHDIVRVHALQAPSKQLVTQWIHLRLRELCSQYSQQIPALILNYTTGNLLATAQVLDKLALITNESRPLSVEEVKEYIISQCDYSLYELADSCLIGEPLKAIRILRQARDTKIEPTLILWLLAQEIRVLLQIHAIVNQKNTVQAAAYQLKVWSNRIPLYQAAIKRCDNALLSLLLSLCHRSDIQVKTTSNKQIWHIFDYIALSLSLGKKVGLLD